VSRRGPTTSKDATLRSRSITAADIALAHLGLAEASVHDGHRAEHTEALEPHDFDIAAFRDMEMQPEGWTA
jgi:hypothetical protein